MSAKSKREGRARQLATQNQTAPITGPFASGMPPQLLAAFAEQRSYSGPIPPPEMLKEYDAIVPGSAGRILDTFHNQSHHRIELENKVINSDISRSNWGLATGF